MVFKIWKQKTSSSPAALENSFVEKSTIPKHPLLTAPNGPNGTSGPIALLSIRVLQTELDTSVDSCVSARNTMIVWLTVLVRLRKLKVRKQIFLKSSLLKDCKYESCADWTVWATWSDCIKIPSSFPDNNLSKNCPPKFRLREKRRCPESEQFCSVIEEEPCACHIAESDQEGSAKNGKIIKSEDSYDIDGLSSASIGKVKAGYSEL